MEGPVQCHDMLYGTARSSLRKENPEKNFKFNSRHQQRKSSAISINNILRIKVSKLYRTVTSFCRRRRTSESSTSRNDGAASDNERLKTVQDHNNDKMLERLVTNTGRQIPIESSHQLVRLTGITVRKDQLCGNDLDEESSDEQQVQHMCSHSSNSTDVKMLAVQTQVDESINYPSTLYKNEASIEDRNQCKPNISPPRAGQSQDILALPLVMKAKKNPDPEMSIPSDDLAKNGGPSIIESGSVVEDLKYGVSALSEGRDAPHKTKSHFLSPRQRTRQRPFFYFEQKESVLRHLTSFRNFNRCPQVQSVKKCPQVSPLWMMSGSEYCYPRFASEETRSNSLRNCTDTQLSGYEYEELARVGWFFNRRALVTFCCGMEMPVTPNGHPLDVHLGLSPQCEFARSFLTPAPAATSREIQTSERQQEDLQELVSGGMTELHFSIPVQATDDVCGASGVSVESYIFNTFPGNFQTGCQESAPGDHWVSDGENYVMSAPTQMSDASYYESLVTSRTPVDAERWQPFSGNQRESSGQERPAGMMQNSSGNAGRLFMRGNAHNPLGSARLLRDLESETGRRSPPYLPPIDQINMDGQHGDNYRARYPQFGFPSVRIWTFEGWPHTHAQTPSMLADAGFFYAGKYNYFFFFFNHICTCMATLGFTFSFKCSQTKGVDL